MSSFSDRWLPRGARPAPPRVDAPSASRLRRRVADAVRRLLPRRRREDLRRAKRARRQALDELGSRLREAREYRRLTLLAASTATKIAPKHLAALETGDLAALPGRAFARAFVQSYARYLGLDADELVALLPAPTQRLERGWHQEPSYTVENIMFWAAVSALVLAFVFVGWFALQFTLWFNAPGQSPSVLAAPTPNPTTAVSDPIPPTPLPTPTPGVNLVIRATEPVTISLIIDNRPVFTGQLQRNETRGFTAERTAVLTTTNAGALEVTFNGQRRGPLGRRGETVEVQWTAPDLRQPIGTPTRTATPAPTPTGERPR